jgi:UDP-N-acetyl-D-glucosamine dehydrogenase
MTRRDTALLAVVGHFDELVATRALTVGVVGLGYTGLPLAHGFAAAGFAVVGYDTDPERAAAVNRGESYLPDVPTADLSAVGDRLSAVTEPAALAAVDALVVCVPTPLTAERRPDLSHVVAAIDAATPHLRKGSLLVLQSTVPPGTTFDAARRAAAATGLRLGEDLHVAFAPERVDPANVHGWNLVNTPKLVGGLTAECTRRAGLLFEQVCATVVPVSSLEVAELAKVFENTFRLVNIALVVELADLCRELGASVREVIDAAATKPYAFLPHYPGPGVGGECIPVDPLFLRAAARRRVAELSLVDAAYRRVARRPQQVVNRVAELLAERGHELRSARVLLVGVSYKAGVADLRNAPAIEIARGLRKLDAEVSYYDPLVPSLVIDGRPVPRATWTPELLAQQDCVVLVTPHARVLADPAWSAAQLVLDTWNLLPEGGNVEVL